MKEITARRDRKEFLKAIIIIQSQVNLKYNFLTNILEKTMRSNTEYLPFSLPNKSW